MANDPSAGVYDPVESARGLTWNRGMYLSTVTRGLLRIRAQERVFAVADTNIVDAGRVTWRPVPGAF
jgi:hypothetical protein